MLLQQKIRIGLKLRTNGDDLHDSKRPYSDYIESMLDIQAEVVVMDK